MSSSAPGPAHISRRDALRYASALGGSAAAWWTLDRWSPARASALRATETLAAAPRGTTLVETIVRRGSGPYYSLGTGPGWPTLVRSELAAPRAGRSERRVPLAAFAHLTDTHLTDSQSPSRVEFLDKYAGPFTAAFRPQETLTTHILTSMVERIRSLGVGPITGRRLDSAVATGDNVDNCQHNELEWFLRIMNGGWVVPNSGRPDRYEGVQDPAWGLTDYYQPAGSGADVYQSRGYPAIAGLIDAATAGYSTPGLDIAWYSTYGNHDGLVQGNARAANELDEIARGRHKLIALPAGLSPVEFALRVIADPPSARDALRSVRSNASVVNEVTPDDNRRLLQPHDWVAAHLRSPGRVGPRGHGFTDDHLAPRAQLHFRFEVAPGVIGLSMDTTNHGGNADGSMGVGQLAWIEQQLVAVSSRYLDSAGHWVRSRATDHAVIVFSHHTSGTMSASTPDPEAPDEQRVLAAQLLALLHRFPNVVAWVNGHTHTHEIHPHPHADTGGFWEITTASHIDFPQHARIIELVDNSDGTWSIFATVVEHAAAAAVDYSATDPIGLASIARELSAAEDGALDRLGGPEVHNVELVITSPIGNGRLAPGSSAATGGTGAPDLAAHVATAVAREPAFTG